MKDNNAATVHFPADDEAVREGVGVARRFARAARLSDDATAKLCIVVEELVTNIVEHGAAAPGSDISVTLATEGGAITLTLSDAGTEFDPSAQTILEAIPERGGGAGLALVRAWASIFDYERRNGHNVLRVVLSAP